METCPGCSEEITGFAAEQLQRGTRTGRENGAESDRQTHPDGHFAGRAGSTTQKRACFRSSLASIWWKIGSRKPWRRSEFITGEAPMVDGKDWAFNSRRGPRARLRIPGLSLAENLSDYSICSANRFIIFCFLSKRAPLTPRTSNAVRVEIGRDFKGLIDTYRGDSGNGRRLL